MKRLIVSLLLACFVLSTMLLIVMPGISIARAETARHCYTYQWKHHHYVCTRWHKDPPPLTTSPHKVYQEAGTPVTFEVIGRGLEPRTFYEFISDLQFACDTVVLNGWFQNPAGLPQEEEIVLFNRYPAVNGLPLVLTPPLAFAFADIGGNASFNITVDGCVKRVYAIHLVSLSAQASEFSTTENISVP